MISIRPYKNSDYEEIALLYKNSELYGGQFDENRDSEERLRAQIESDPESILIAAEKEGKMVGTISLIVDKRVAWFFRFAVSKGEYEREAAKALYEKAASILKSRGHNQVLVYTPYNDMSLYTRYENLGFTKGSDYTCYWKDI